MSLEQALASLQAAVEANTAALGASKAAVPVALGASKAAVPAALGASKAAVPGAASVAAAKAEPKGYQPKHTKEEMQVAINAVMQASDKTTARAVMAACGYEGKVSEMADPETIDKVYAGAKAKIEELDAV